ncbi:MAG: flagellar hook-associated protein FlgL [Pseudomonadota bacterium]
MRLTNYSVYDVNVNSLNQLQVKLAHSQQQLSTGRRIVTPADDPAAMARSMEITQADSLNNQYAANRVAITNTLSLTENALSSATTLLQDIKTIAMTAGNTSISNADRQVKATELQGRLTDLLALANSTDGAGSYLFSGFQGGTVPFVMNGASTSYLGDDGQRMIQVSSSRTMASNISGADAFMRVKDGNGIFSVTPGAGNTGSSYSSMGAVINPAAMNGNSYQVQFTVAAGVTTYVVMDTTTATQVAPPLPAVSSPYVSGQAITFGGMQINVTGSPANGDTYNVQPSQNTNVFSIISNFATALANPVSTSNPASQAAFTQSLNTALAGLDSALSSVLNVRTTVGARLSEVDILNSNGEALGAQYKQAMSQLIDLDYNKAISDFSQQLTMLQAAQKSFKSMMDMTLFNYM